MQLPRNIYYQCKPGACFQFLCTLCGCVCLVLSVTKCTVEKLNNLNVYRKNGEDPSLMHQLIHHHPNLSTSNCHSLGPLLLRFLQSHLTAYEKSFLLLIITFPQKRKRKAENHQDQPSNDADGSRQGRRIISLEACSLSSERRHYIKHTQFFFGCNVN